jgi:organic radical activating enzyme
VEQARERETAIEPAAWLSEIFVSFQGEGSLAGQKQLFVRLAGCNIRCGYCDTPDSLTRVPACELTLADGSRRLVDNPLSAAQLSDIIDSLCAATPDISMIALTGGEPMVQHEFLAHWLESRPPPRPCLLETNATITADLDRILPHVAVVSADVKLPSNSGERPLWEVHRGFLAACRGSEVYVKLPVDAATDPAEVARAARLVADCAPDATLFLQPITEPAGARWQVSVAGLLELVATAKHELARTQLRPQLHKLVGIR